MHGLQPCGALVVCGRRLRILRALIAFSCQQQLIKYRLFTTKLRVFFNAFLTHLRDLFQKSHVEPVVCARCLFLQAIPHLRLPSEISRQTSRRYGVPFFVCVPHTVAKTLQAGSSAAFEASSCQQFQPLHLPSSALWFILSQEPVVCARRLRILCALIAFSCRQQLYNNKRISFTDFST